VLKAKVARPFEVKKIGDIAENYTGLRGSEGVARWVRDFRLQQPLQENACVRMNVFQKRDLGVTGRDLRWTARINE
jgi:hypothetical protein